MKKTFLLLAAVLSFIAIHCNEIAAQGMAEINQAIAAAKSSGRPIFGHAGTKT